MLGDALRKTLHRALSTDRGDRLAAVRLTKEVARSLNTALGAPICSEEELERRRAAQARLAELRGKAVAPAATREPAPVMVYYEKDRNQRLLDRVEQTLAARGIAFRKLDVSGDPNTKSFVMREARCEEDDLPVVFVAGDVVGGLEALVAADVSGELVKKVFG